MRIETYFQSLSQEFDALKDRVRYLIEDRHWQTDGEWKESVVRQVLRRHLPPSVSVGRGFVVTSTAETNQLDILIYDSSKPVVFRDGDLAIVTPDAVLGVIEVKASGSPSKLRAAAEKLATDMDLIRKHPNSHAFAGFIAFDDAGGSTQAYLRAVRDTAERWNNRLDFASIGRSRFIRYWHFDPYNSHQVYEGWHSYALPDTAPGYFIHNVVDAISPQSVFSNREVWFPADSKEVYVDGERRGRWRTKGA
jgi:hypothetical protein